MTIKDQQKVLNAGLRIIRMDLFRMEIKIKTKENPGWKTLEKGFKFKTEIEHRMKELLQDKLTIED